MSIKVGDTFHVQGHFNSHKCVGFQDNGDPISDNGLPYQKDKCKPVKSANAEWSISFTVDCPSCEKENDLMDIDEWWILLGEVGQSQQDVNYVHKCVECGTEFNIKDIDY